MGTDHDWRDFATFYASTCQPIIASLAVFCGDWDAAGDAASEAFTRACERWRRVSRMEQPSGWVYQVGVNVLRRRGRRAAIEARAVERHLQVGAPEMSPTDNEAIWDAVRELPDRQRQAIALRYLVGLTQAEIASVMSVAPGTVAATLAHGRAALAEALAEEAEVPE